MTIVDFAVLGYFTLPPSVCLLRFIDSAISISGSSSPPPTNPTISIWGLRLWYAIGPPLALVSFILGFVIKCGISQFVSADEVLRTIILFPTIATIATAPVREKNTALGGIFERNMTLSLVVAV